MSAPHSSRPAPTTRCLGTDFTSPVDDRYFEDYVEGGTYEYGHLSATEDEIVEYARQFDPQAIHIDRDYARSGPFGGIIASGWHTASLMMRMFADHYLTHNASLASPGIDEVRWPAPLRPGDQLKLRVTTAEARPSKSKPDRGLIFTDAALINADDLPVMTLRAMNMIARRNPG
ncbi:MaoC family dehydratase [Sporichthya sp.]|uniref:MaoC family dehydratase n=1 Tax=Sporichthya sp. TaxID=65475 RepID=UPI00180CC58F|nr:MaoC family dehydratase [Sporichthya sp.]MBA3743073.1 MaoC family dehydratase [Sporichthya sp.]